MFPTPTQDLELAKLAFAKGDLSHAAHHIACAIAIDPLSPQYTEMMRAIVDEAEDPLALVPTKDGAFYGTVALRAFMLAEQGDYQDAIDLLMQVVGVKPDVPYLEWMDRWLEQDGVLEALDPDGFAVSCQKCIDGLERNAEDPRYGQAVLPELVARIGRVREFHDVAERLAFVHSIAARRAGDLDLSLQVAQELDTKAPSYLVCVALAGAHRERGELAEAIAAFRRALEHEPQDVAARLDIGDLSIDLGLTEEALDAYDEALSIDANHPWALASRFYLKWMADGDPAWRDELEALANQSPDNPRARQLLDAGTPYVGYLPDPSEASVNAAERVVEQFEGKTPEEGGEVEMELSAIEAPSAHLATYRMLKEIAGFDLVVRAQSIPDPDPREAWGETTYVLWRYEGTTPSPALPPPNVEVASRIRDIATTRFSIEDWKDHAHYVASSIGFAAVESVLATMLYPPPRPANGVAEWDWMFRIQVAAGLVLLYIDEGWQDSVRRRALTSLLHGPIDWTTSAAIIALAELARDEPEYSPWVVDRFVDLLDRRPDSGYWCIEHPLVKALLRVPGVPEDIYKDLRDYEFE